MDSHKICFIMCSNDDFLAEECLLYISQLEVPKGYCVDTKVIHHAPSMAAGYNQAMRESDAKYKVYLHQDVLLIHKMFLADMLSLFAAHPQIGILGPVGNTSLALDGCPWSDGMHRRIGELYSDLIYKKEHCIFSKIKGEYEEAVVLDGLLMATQYDLPWREDLFQGWDFYDCSQTLEFWKAGYQAAVPYMEKPWCLHDNDILHLEHYETWRRLFEKEYGNCYKDWKQWRKKKWKAKRMSSTQEKKVIYQVFDKERTWLDFPYPPIYKEQGADYLCFTDDRAVHSSFWSIRYIEHMKETDIQACLSDYTEQYKLRTDQIQVGPVLLGCGGQENVVSIPSLEEIPGVTFHKEDMVPTANKKGAYQYKKNPVYTGGKYHGRPLLLTIGVPVSNQIETIERCLSHVKPLLDELDAELVVIDTGSTDGTVDVCKSYGARIVVYPWCDNMSAVRNAGIYHAKGEWYLSIDDDEWFENVDDILRFFKSGMYRKCDTATYIQRSYQILSGEIYHDNHTLRMARITPELHFEGRIHDSMIVPFTAKNCQLFSYTHHYGFVVDDVQKAREKYTRNTSILLYDVYEYPADLRYNFQLANELKCESYYKQAIAYFIRGIAIESEMADPYFGKLHVVNLLSSLHDSKDERTFAYTEFLKNKYRLTAAEQAFLNYNLAELASLFQKPAEEILRYCLAYERHRKDYEKNPHDSQQNTYLGLQACTNEPYLVDIHVFAFSAYIMKQEEEKALLELEQIPMDKVFNQQRLLLKQMLLSGEHVFQASCSRLTPQRCESWLEEIMDAFLVSICRDDIYKRQFVRLPELLKKLSIQGIRRYLERFYPQLTGIMRQRLYGHAMERSPQECPMQEQYLCAYILKEKYRKEGKQKQDRKLFGHYVNMMGAFLSSYYQKSLLEDQAGNVLPADLRAVYLIYKGCKDGRKNSSNIKALKQALEIFPGFKSEIQHLLQQFLPAPSVPSPLSPQDEMETLFLTLKKQVSVLLQEGKTAQAKPILVELATYFPKDQKIREMLRKAEGAADV